MLSFYIDNIDKSLQISLQREQILIFYAISLYSGCSILLHFLCSKIRHNYCERKDLIPRFLRHIGWYDAIAAFLSIFFVVALFEADSTPRAQSLFGDARAVIVTVALVFSLVLIASHGTVTGYYLIFCAMFTMKGLSPESENFINRNRKWFVICIWVIGLIPTVIYLCTASYQNQSMYIFANDATAQMLCLIVLLYKRRRDRNLEESSVEATESTVVYPLEHMIYYRMSSIIVFFVVYTFSHSVIDYSLVFIYLMFNHFVSIYAFPLIFILHNRILANNIIIAAVTRR
ncbi:hypothetical protein WR25_09060 [Diploscapter pachys]|uniref:Uncharacterized protein n=1 Tax=Diploscapter pachys TaxID=2018661 RepID=A0A2A2LAV9_9BILA|nr:hypothetical protein WR25_09060 [Diploscapter pachys]